MQVVLLSSLLFLLGGFSIGHRQTSAAVALASTDVGGKQHRVAQAPPPGLSNPTPLGISSIESCEEAVAWAQRTKHDCDWAGTLLQAHRRLGGTCNLTNQTTQLREARLILESCAARPPEDMQAPELRREPLNPWGG